MKERDYSLLRSSRDSRPQWMISIGLHSAEINGKLVEREYPRLSYKRKFGSYVCNPYMEEDKKSIMQRRFDERLKQLLNKV